MGWDSKATIETNEFMRQVYERIDRDEFDKLLKTYEEFAKEKYDQLPEYAKG